MGNDDVLMAASDGPEETHARLPGDLPELRKWPAACRPEEDCLIDGDL